MKSQLSKLTQIARFIYFLKLEISCLLIIKSLWLKSLFYIISLIFLALCFDIKLKFASFSCLTSAKY